MNSPPILNSQEIKDHEHLKLLSIFHYVVGAITMAFSSIFLIHVAMGIAMVIYPGTWSSGKGAEAPPRIPWIFPGYFCRYFRHPRMDSRGSYDLQWALHQASNQAHLFTGHGRH